MDEGVGPEGAPGGRRRWRRWLLAGTSVAVAAVGIAWYQSMQRVGDASAAIGLAIGDGIAEGAVTTGSALAGVGAALDDSVSEGGRAPDPSTPAATLRHPTVEPLADGTVRACAEVEVAAGQALDATEWEATALPRDGSPTLQPAIVLVDPVGATTGRICVGAPAGVVALSWEPEPGRTRTWLVTTAPDTTSSTQTTPPTTR